MSTEERALREREVTRSILHRVLLDPRALLTMVAHGIGPEDMEAKVTELLEYLERTREERAGDG